MMLNKKYRYVGLDFETTGLDLKKDEPIQIGIVELDGEGNIVKEFQSLIKPTKRTDELKHIVGFITGFSISDLEHAPSREEVFEKISSFFGDDVILIGHNIQFDIDFLNQYFPGLSLAFSMDTFKLGQSLVHYAPSYALEVIVQHLYAKEPCFSDWLKRYNLSIDDEGSFHDALYDTKNTLAVYMFFMEYIHNLVKKYPNLAIILRLDLEYFSKIFLLDDVVTSSPIQFPVLERLSPSHTSLKTLEKPFPLDTTVHAQKYYIGNIDIQSLLADIATHKNIILSFSHPQKLDIAKHVLHSLGMKNLGFLREDQTINENKFHQFLNKGIFSHEEVLFVIKYLSHLSKGYGTLELNNKYDYQVYSFIKDSRGQTKYPMVLSTHGSLFSMLTDTNHVYRDYSIYFFDTESWYKNYNFFLSRPCDLYYTLNFIETLLYKSHLKSQFLNNETNENFGIDTSGQSVSVLQDFYQFFQILIGELFIETKKLFTNTPKTTLQHDPIMGNSDFYQTNLFFDQVRDYIEKLEGELKEADFTELSRQIAHMFSVFDSTMYINKKMYGSSDFYFTYSDNAKFTSWDEFVELFNHTHITFFSNTNKQYKKLAEFDGKSSVSLTFYEDKYTELIEHLSSLIKEKSDPKRVFFVVSTQKEQSKKIFEELYEKDIHKEASLLVENITGGVGKNIFKAKNTDSDRILIGGYSFLLYLYSHDIKIDEIMVFNVRGPSRDYILDDIRRYAST